MKRGFTWLAAGALLLTGLQSAPVYAGPGSVEILLAARRPAKRFAVPTVVEAFDIDFGDAVSNGIPAPGAGNLEAPGAVDVYHFDGTAGQPAIFDWLSGSNVDIGWSLAAPDGGVLFNTFLQDRQPVLPQTGTYTLTVDGNNSDDFGLYAFRLLEVPAPQPFAISLGDTVSDSVPAAGAGNLEAPGALDVYTFHVLAGQPVLFDHLTGSNVLIGWALEAPGGTRLFDNFLRDQQPVLPAAGTYTLTVRGNGIDDFGAYSFSLLAACPPQQFAIDLGDSVSDGVPAPGAGNLEVPGATDVYTFAAQAGQAAIFDWLSGSNVALGWTLAAPDQTVLFDTVLQDHQPVLPQTGTYTLTVRGNGLDDTGVYSFALLEDSAPLRLFLPLLFS